MFKVTTNAKSLAAKWRRRSVALKAAARKGLRNAAIAVDNAQVENLSGSGGAGSYPIPVRSGNLRGGHFFDAKRSDFAIVGNTTVYAMAIHDERPFLDKAADSVNVVDIMAIPIFKEALA